MGFRTSTTRRVEAASSVGQQTVVINSGAGSFSVTGQSVTASTPLTIGIVTPGQTSAASTTSAQVLISNVVYTDINYNTLTANAASTTFGYVRILGSSFAANANVFISNANSVLTNVTANTTFISTTEIRANVPSISAGNYTLYVFNSSGSAAIYYSGVAFEPYPLWTTTSATFGGNVISGNVATFVTSTAGIQPITFALASGNTLPSGLTLYSNGAIIGSVTQANSTQTYYTNIIATDLYNEATTANIALTVNLTDPQFNVTSLLINGDTSGVVNIMDASTNNLAVTVNGNPQTSYFSPFLGSYYSNYFNGSTDYLTVATSSAFAFGTSNFTVEGWFYLTGLNVADGIFQTGTSYFPTSTTNSVAFGTSGSGNFQIYANNTNINPSPAVAPVLNTWTHFAIVRNSSTTALYINGVSVLTVSDSTNYTGTYVGIGLIFGSGNYAFNGYLSNFRIVNGTAVYTSTFTPPTSPLTAITNTVLLTCQSNRFIDNSTNALTLTISGSPKVQSFVPFATTANTSVGSTYFNGSTDYLSSPSVPDPSGNFTIEFWWFPTTLSPSYQEIFTKGPGIQIYTASSTISFAFSASNSTSYYVTGGFGTVISNQWNHIAVVRNGNSYTGYLNGSGTLGGTSSSSPNTGSSPINIATYSSGSYLTAGYISNVRYVVGTAVYTSNFTPPTSPLTAVANTSLLTLQSPISSNNGVFVDSSSFSASHAPITVAGTPTQGTFSPFSQTGWSNYFNGSTDYLNLGSQAVLSVGTGNFTWECWFMQPYAQSTTGGYGRAHLFITNESGSPNGFQVGLSGDPQGSSGFNIYIANGTPITNTTPVVSGVWYHLAVTRSSGTVVFYINGVSAGSSTLTGSLTSTAYSIGKLQATLDSYSDYFLGYISNMRITNTVVYTSNFTPPTSPLTAISGTSLLTCQSNRFIDNSSNNFTITVNGKPSVQAFSPFPPGVAYSTSANGGSMYFNGSTDTLGIGTNSEFSFGTGDFTIELWYYATSFSGGNNYIFDMNANGTCMQLYSSNLYFTPAGNSAVTTTLGYVLNTWFHVAMVRQSGTLYGYLNGVKFSSTSLSTNLTDPQLTIGNYGGGGGYHFNGYITDFRIVKGTAVYPNGTTFTIPTAPLSSIKNTVLLLNGTNGGIVDATAKNNLITVGNVRVESNTIKYGTGALRFDGSTGYLKSPLSPLFTFGTGNFTVECWIYVVGTGAQTIASDNYNYSSGTGNWAFYFNSSPCTIYFNSSSGNHASSTTWTYSLNTWYHIAYCRSGTSGYFFINGVQLGTTLTDSFNYSAAPGILYIGSQNDGSGLFNGYMDDLRITQYARYTTNFTPPTSAFLTE